MESTKRWNREVTVAIITVLVTIILNFINNQANRQLLEESLEAELFIKAIDIGDKKKSEQNLSFLLKLDLISKRRKDALQKLTDSIYSKETINLDSDTVGFFTLKLSNEKKNASAFDTQLRGVRVEITSLDSIKQPLHLIGYSDYKGEFDISYPKYYSSSFVKIKIEKKGYKSMHFTTRLPDYGELTDVLKEIIIFKN